MISRTSFRHSRCYPVLFLAALMMLAGCRPTPVLFRGNVLQIESSPIYVDPEFRYKVTTQVENVLEGQFKGDKLIFRIQDPYLAGIKEGGTYLFLARPHKWTYSVDAYQQRQQIQDR